jgi:DNA-directed RNA polymerase subunit M/transcription elongation factor TFIIS
MSGFFDIKCPSCSTELELEGSRQEWDGQVFACPVCRTHLRVLKPSIGDPRETITSSTSPYAEHRVHRRSSTPPVDASAPTTNILFQCPRCRKIICVSDKAIGMTLPCAVCKSPAKIYKPSVHFNCIKCNSALSAFGSIMGKSAQCPNCQELITVPPESPR